MDNSAFSDFLDPDAVWSQRLRPDTPRNRPALFLDRDGTLVEEIGFLHRPDELRLLPGACELVAMANRRDIPVVLVTNQSGIGRGMFGWPEFLATQIRLTDQLGASGAAIDMVLACPHYPDGGAPYRHPDHPCRKPRPGMILRAAERLDLDLARSWIVGDRPSDVAAGRAAGLAGAAMLTESGSGADPDEASALAQAGYEVRLTATLQPAMRLPLFGSGRD